MPVVESWPRCAEAAAFFERQMGAFADANPIINDMTARFVRVAAVNLLNLVDHWALPETATLREELTALGLTEQDADGAPVWAHPAARLPRL